MKKLLWSILISLLLTARGFSGANSCGGDGALLSLLNRPTFQDSACTVPSNHLVLEMGYANQLLNGNAGHGYDVPEAVLRLGLPNDNELFFIFPDYFNYYASGFDAPTLGMKHEFVYTPNWLLSGEISVTLPTGSQYFGNTGYGATINTLFAYNITSEITLSTVLGVSTQTAPSGLGGQRFNSFNPDFVLAWKPQSRLQIYGELYGQSQILPGVGPTYLLDGGVQYLITKNFEVDFSAGLPLKGDLGFVHYIAIGLGIMF